MTNEKVIEYLNDIKYITNSVIHNADERENVQEALNKSIKALEQTRWIPVSERLPEEHEWIGTKVFGTTISDEVYVTFESPKGERFAKHLSFQSGMVRNAVQREIDAFHKGSVPVAWMPLPQPYEAESDVHCNCTNEEIAKSFIEDVEAVKDLLPKAESEEEK